MSSRAIRGPLQFDAETILTAAGNYTIVNESVLIVKKGANAGATQVTLPKPRTMQGRTVIIKDGQGDAATNNITVVTDGVGATTIDGVASKLIVANYGAVALNWNGTEWGAVIDNSGSAGSDSFTTLSANSATFTQEKVTSIFGNGGGLTINAAQGGNGTIGLGAGSDSLLLGSTTAGGSASTYLGQGSYSGTDTTGFANGGGAAILNGFNATGGLGTTSFTFSQAIRALKQKGILPF